MDRRSEGKQPTTRPERAKARRRAQGRRNTAAWRRRKRAEREAQQPPQEARREPAVDPIWRDDPQHPMNEPIPPGGLFFQPTPEPDPEPLPPEPEEPEPAKPEPKYVRHAARLKKAPKGEVGPQRGGESAASWEQPGDRNPCSVPIDPDTFNWKN